MQSLNIDSSLSATSKLVLYQVDVTGNVEEQLNILVDNANFLSVFFFPLDGASLALCLC